MESLSIRMAPPGEAPQSWNRYAYVLGNPLKFVDPFGRQEARFEGEITICVNAASGLPCAVASLIAGRALLDSLDSLDTVGSSRGVGQGPGLLDVAIARSFYEEQSDAAESAAAIFALESILDFLPESQAELGIELAFAVFPPGKFAKLAKNAKTPVRKLIRGSLKRSSSYAEELAGNNLEELIRLSQGKGKQAVKAKKMLKLITEESRLLDKPKG